MGSCPSAACWAQPWSGRTATARTSLPSSCGAPSNGRASRRGYAPTDPDAWARIAEAESEDTPSLSALILDVYAPGGEGHDALVEELTSAALLADRRRGIEEILASLRDGRHYVTICGTLPLVEGSLATAYGRWQKHVVDYRTSERLDTHGDLTSEEEAELLMNISAVHSPSRDRVRLGHAGERCAFGSSTRGNRARRRTVASAS
jgi:hypothetical protein